jgi:hypothetical protein
LVVGCIKISCYAVLAYVVKTQKITMAVTSQDDPEVEMPRMFGWRLYALEKHC